MSEIPVAVNCPWCGALRRTPTAERARWIRKHGCGCIEHQFALTAKAVRELEAAPHSTEPPGPGLVWSPEEQRYRIVAPLPFGGLS